MSPIKDPIQPRVIWLSPMCEGCERRSGSSPEDGQLWSVSPQDECPECGLGWTRYVLDEAQRTEMIRERLPPDFIGPGCWEG